MKNQLNLDNKYYNHFLGKLINRTLGGLLSFIIALFISFSLRAFFGFGTVTLIVLLFMFSIFISPFFSKFQFRIGFVIEEKYFKFLDKQISRWNKKK